MKRTRRIRKKTTNDGLSRQQRYYCKNKEKIAAKKVNKTIVLKAKAI
jgi:hypothetical protein